MPEIIRETRVPGLTHSGSAPATTSPRKLSGRAFGVSTSTVTPSSRFASWRIAAISSKVVSGVGSTSRSKSLSSVSFPDNIDPKRRGLRTRYRSTKARSASRFRLSDSEGRMAKWYPKGIFPCYGLDDGYCSCACSLRCWISTSMARNKGRLGGTLHRRAPCDARLGTKLLLATPDQKLCITPTPYILGSAPTLVGGRPGSAPR